MKIKLYNIKNFKDVFLKPNSKSEIVSQLLYGEKFIVLFKKNNWLKIKTNYDNYIGYIINKDHCKKLIISHKISKPKAQIYKLRNNKFIKTKIFLPFASKIQAISLKKKYIKFENGKWIKKIDVKGISHKIYNYQKILKFFKNSKYKWGGKSFTGIDCSGLVQIIFYYNQLFCPRDTKKQLPFFKKKNIKFTKLRKNIIFWKGHVAVCISKKKLIHAYGPKKKVLIMDKSKTIDIIFKTTKLKPLYI